MTGVLVLLVIHIGKPLQNGNGFLGTFAIHAERNDPTILFDCPSIDIDQFNPTDRSGAHHNRRHTRTITITAIEMVTTLSSVSRSQPILPPINHDQLLHRGRTGPIYRVGAGEMRPDDTKTSTNRETTSTKPAILLNDKGFAPIQICLFVQIPEPLIEAVVHGYLQSITTDRGVLVGTVVDDADGGVLDAAEGELSPSTGGA